MEINLETGSEIPPATAVINAVAEYNGLDPLELEKPLAEVIDPDALNTIIGDGVTGDGFSDITVQFPYNGCQVHATSDGSVKVRSLHSE